MDHPKLDFARSQTKTKKLSESYGLRLDYTVHFDKTAENSIVSAARASSEKPRGLECSKSASDDPVSAKLEVCYPGNRPKKHQQNNIFHNLRKIWCP